MIDLNGIKSIYFIGIGGIGMSALARYFNARGIRVSGYDRTANDFTSLLESEGMSLHYEDNPDLIPKDADLIVYTPAIPKEHKELNWYINKGYDVIKRSDLLQAVTASSYTIAVAGTHGKTTTSTLIAHLLKHTGYDCTAFLGGLSTNYNTNYIAGKNNTIVVEADEYDRSFLKLHPDIAIVTSTDADHLDIYGSKEEVESGYFQFTQLLKPNGKLIINHRIPVIAKLEGAFISYDGSNRLAHVYGSDIHIKDGKFVFTYNGLGHIIPEIIIHTPGLYNIENMVAAITVALLLNIKPEDIKTAAESFLGVKRRFEFIVRNNNHIYIDDYAHHPTEIEACLRAVKSLFPNKKLTCIFQPHLFTRTRDFAAGFSRALSIADDVIMLPIYPAREQPIEGITSEMILKNVLSHEKQIVDKESLMALIKSKNPALLITLGAGDIDQFVHPLKALLEIG